MSNEETRKTPAQVGVRVVSPAAPPGGAPISKAETMIQIEPESAFSAGDWIPHPYSFDGLETLASQSTILPQCVTAYRNNVCGFGLAIDYLDEYKQWDEQDHPELAEEYAAVQRVLNLLAADQDAKDVFGQVVATRERYGIAYIEVMRNLEGEVVEIKNIRRPGTVYMTSPMPPYVPVKVWYRNEEIERHKRFRAFRQEVDGRVVYFREFGDPRVMDLRTGRYVEDGELDVRYRANELLALPIGDKPYGEVRWIGQVLSMAGAHKAESLNANYFDNGRHTPMMIMIEGGTLSDESFAKLQEYMNDIRGERGQHAFMVLESETTNEIRTGLEQETAPKITVKDLSPMLQKDELFQGYIDNARKKVQSAFLLPDLYVGYTTDFNRATAQTAMEVTEKQVFIPYRQELAWLINHRLLAGYRFRYCEVSFRGPDITNPEDQSRILEVVERAGGLTPNEAHRLAGAMTGDTAEDFTGDWAGVPLAVQQVLRDAAQSAPDPDPATPDEPDRRVEDAEAGGSDELIAVMRQVRKALVELTEGGAAPEPEPEPEPVKAAMSRFMMRPEGDAQ